MGLDLTVGGRPVEIVPLETEADFEARDARLGPIEAVPMTLYSTSYLDGVITSPLCECGHSLRAHEGDGHCAAEVGSVPQGNEAEGCPCRRFRREPLCLCGHVRDCHEHDGPCVPVEHDAAEGVEPETLDPEDVCDCAAWRPVNGRNNTRLDTPGFFR